MKTIGRPVLKTDVGAFAIDDDTALSITRIPRTKDSRPDRRYSLARQFLQWEQAQITAAHEAWKAGQERAFRVDAFSANHLTPKGQPTMAKKPAPKPAMKPKGSKKC